MDRACEALRAGQHADGWWKGELETNVTMDAEDLLLRAFLGIRTEAETAATAAWIRSQQRADGTWSTFHEGPGDLSTTVEAWLALRVAGDPTDAAHMQEAARFVRDCGGVESTRVFTRIWLALFVLWPWEAVPVLPPELVLLPPWVPLNIYDFGCWARQTIVPLMVVSAYRPVRSLPAGVGVAELRVGAAPRRSAPFPSWERAFERADRALQRYETHPVKALRRLALNRAEQWIVHRQEADGGWGGIQPPWVYSLIALRLRGYRLDHPVVAAGLTGLEGFIVRDERGRRLEACQSPVWDTALAVTALADAGAARDDPGLVAAASWLVDRQILVRGDWSVRRPSLAPGGWAFEFANDTYPDIDDTAEVALALGRVDVTADTAIARAAEWMVGMQCRDGGWGAFDVDNTRELCRRLPFCDFGELIDPPSADVTAHAVEFLCAAGGDRGPIERGVAWLLRAQDADGSWFGRWGANHVYGTGAAVAALAASGLATSAPPIQRAVAWLHRHQNSDGGWGEDLRSYRDDSWRGRGASTPSQTAWALLALIAADPPPPDPRNAGDGGALERGVAWLVDNQRPDGTWDEPWFTGTGFPGDFYINYHLYRLVFPIMALGRYLGRGDRDA
ncbi:MAG TPA: squalene--hopene cyclase [Acidimicrobiia bacterium]|nr:squalene--hopene cyclase [Acidimicrobiia bacterium]